MAKKTVTTCPEQGHERAREMRGGLKSPALVVLETTRYPTQRKNSPFENNQIQSSGKGGCQTQSGGTDGGYKPAFYFAGPSIHEGFKPSFKRFHNQIRQRKLVKKARLMRAFLCAGCSGSSQLGLRFGQFCSGCGGLAGQLSTQGFQQVREQRCQFAGQDCGISIETVVVLAFVLHAV